MTDLTVTKRYDPRFFATIRILLGLYIAYYFVRLLPYAADIYATGGIMPPPSSNELMAFAPFLAAPLSALTVQIILCMLALVALAFAAGVVRVPAALILWLGMTALFIRNPLTEDPSMAFTNLLLLLTAIVPTGEGWAIGKWRADAAWYMPRMVYLGAWVVLEITYTASGIDRLLAPSWQDGAALHHLFTLATVFHSPLTLFVQSLPAWVLAVLTYAVSAAFFLAVPLCLFGKTRPYAWLMYMLMFIFVGLIINLTQVILGVLLFQLFLFDIEWIRTGPFARIYRRAVYLWKRA